VRTKNYRVAVADASLGAPEVNLGIIPGAEGTQRLPRLVGVAAAVEMCVTGKPVKAPEALRLGLIDQVIESEMLAGAVSFARNMAGEPVRKTRERNERLGSAAENAPIFASGRAQAGKIRRNQTAPLAALEALEAATTLPFEEGCKKEREIVRKVLAGDQAKAMIHVFFAERAVARVPGIPKDTAVYPIAKVGIIGAGTMGGGISMACANAGISVRLKETEQAALDEMITSDDQPQERRQRDRQHLQADVVKGREFHESVMESFRVSVCISNCAWGPTPTRPRSGRRRLLSVSGADPAPRTTDPGTSGAHTSYALAPI